MGDTFPTIKGAAVQAASVFLDRDGSTKKACDLIREAGANGARFIVLPEGFIPAHPVWFHLYPATGHLCVKLSTELFKNSVEVPGPEVTALGEAARDADAFVVVGICEKLPGTIGTMYNTQLFFGRDGQYLGKHQKLTPTVGERLVHAGGYGDTLTVFDTEIGHISGLICGENSNPLAVFSLTAQNTQIHAMSWPNFFPTSGSPLGERVAVDARAFAQMSKAWVVSACGTVDEAMISLLAENEQQEKYLRDPNISGGSVIVAPNMKVIAGPMGNEEGILYGDMDLEIGVQMKLRHDFSGHYNRPDVFQLHVNRSVPQLYTEEGTATPIADMDDEAESVKSGSVIFDDQAGDTSKSLPRSVPTKV